MPGLSFISPWWLTGLPILMGGLVYVYLRRASQKTKIVSTLLLLKDFTKSSSEKAKVELPIRFFIELALLTLLICLLARIQSIHHIKKIAIVLDDSLSTQAMGKDGESLYTTIKKEAIEFLDNTSSSDIFDLYRTGTFTPVAQGVGGGEVEDLINTDPKDFLHADQLTSLIQAASKNGYDEVRVFTDRESSGVAASSALIFDSLRDRLKTKDNIAIERGFFNPQDGQIHTSIRSFSSKPFAGSVEVSGGERKQFSLEPGEAIEIALHVSSAETKPTIVKLSLSEPASDAISLDNQVRISLTQTVSDKIFIVSDLSDESLGLGGISTYSFSHLNSKEYESNPGKYHGRAIIFHRYAPDHIPPEPSFFVLPGDTKLFQSRGLFSRLSVTRWDNADPITTYLHLDLFSVSQAQTFVPQPWQQIVVSSEEGPLLLTAENAGVRSVVSGFEIFPFRGKEAPLLSIMTLNILKWLTDQNGVTTGSHQFFSEDESDLAANTIDVGGFDPPVKPQVEDPRNILRTLVSLLLLAFCIADLTYFLLRNRLIGGKA